MKNTAFTLIHEKYGAKIIPFAGYNMPVQYEGINIEHEIVRNGVGVFDVSHMGEIWIKGENAFELVQRLTTNDVNKLSDGQVQYTCFPNGNGGIIDDLLVYRIDSLTYLLVVNASNINKDWDWVKQNNRNNAIIYNASDEISQLAIQGPKAKLVLQKITNADLNNVPYYSFIKANVSTVNDVIISATGYTGAGGYEIYFANKDAEVIWDAIFKAGAEYNIKPIGLAARDTLRLEMGFCLYGNDINDSTSPIEAGLAWITKFVDGNDFINRDIFQKQKEDGPKRRLRGFEMIDKGIPRQHYEILNEEGKVIGEVTSGTMSPSLKKAIGMGYIEIDSAKFDSEIFIKVRNKQLKAKIVRTPFYKS